MLKIELKMRTPLPDDLPINNHTTKIWIVQVVFILESYSCLLDKVYIPLAGYFTCVLSFMIFSKRDLFFTLFPVKKNALC